MAAWSHEVGSDTLFERTLLGEPILLYRDPAGQSIALTNRCCHRHAPLSLGRKEADCIRCNYHGLKFDRTGRCVEAPGQASVPEKLCVRAWPMVERHNWLWLWMGDAVLADPALIPAALSLDHPDWKFVSDYLHYQAPYLLICDNLLDFSHLSYVHANTLGGSTDIAESRPQVTTSARSVRVQRFIPNTEPSPAQRQHHGLTGKVDRTFVYDFLAPAVMLLDTRSETVGEPEGPRLHMHSCQALTPETETTTHYFFSQAHQTGLSEPQDRKRIHTALLAAFAEDQHIIQAQFRTMQASPGAESMMPIAADLALTQFRRVMSQLIDTESTAGQPLVRAEKNMA